MHVHLYARAPLYACTSIRMHLYTHAPLYRLAAIYNIHGTHISHPMMLAGLMAGAGRKLQCGGKLLLYGIFSQGGEVRMPIGAHL